MKTALLTLLLTASASAETAKIFTDKGSQYVRSDNKKALTVGAELNAVTDPAGDKAVGKAIIMEVNGALARVSLDEEATKGGAKFVVISGGKPAAASPAGPVVAKADSAAPAAAPRPKGPKLDGKLEAGALRVSWNNFSDQNWSNCLAEFQDGAKYKVGEVVKHSEDGVLKVKFSAPPEPLYDHVRVTCAEGNGQFFFDKPQAPVGSLKGYATNDSGSIVLYNSSGSAWTMCDVAKPNGSHYVVGTLKGGDQESISRGNFKKEAQPKGPRWIELRCDQGELHTDY